MVRTHPIDGSLPPWEDVESEADWQAVLLGNGLSVNLWPDFAYTSLYERARSGSPHGRLRRCDLLLFDEFGTENFEIVLGNLNTAIRTNSALGQNSTPLVQRYKSIQAALGGAVRAVHITRSDVSELALETIKLVMEDQSAIFTTSYDLMVYWAMGHGEHFGNLVDLFWSDHANGRCAFDPANAHIWPGYTPVYFLHGALHLIVDTTGTTYKLVRRADETILDQFGQPIPGEPQARPLLISEGSAHDKRRAIDSNTYLDHALDQLYACDAPMVVFGSALGIQDMHLIEALNDHPDRPVAVSLEPRSKTDIRAIQGEIRSRLHAHELHFYDATTHPLGSPELRCRTTTRS
jgi:hypothetical protein